MFGKHFASMYEGSMVGSGALTFAVWGYVIARMEPDKVVGMQVDLNPKLIGPCLGESSEEIAKVIERFCQPDAASRTKDEEGRKLVQVGVYSYRVVNGMKYRMIRDKEARREYNRVKKAEERAAGKHPRRSKPSPGEPGYIALLETQGPEAADDMLDRRQQ